MSKLFKLSMNPDPWNAWIYDTRHRDYNSDLAKSMRRRREQALANCDPQMIAQAIQNDDERARRQKMSSHHIVNGKFQSDKYPWSRPGYVPFSLRDPLAQDLLWIYAQRRKNEDMDFSNDLQLALTNEGFRPSIEEPISEALELAYEAARPDGVWSRSTRKLAAALLRVLPMLPIGGVARSVNGKMVDGFLRAGVFYAPVEPDVLETR